MPLRIRPIDILVVNHPQPLSNEAVASVRSYVSSQTGVPEEQVIVLMEGVTMTVFRGTSE